LIEKNIKIEFDFIFFYNTKPIHTQFKTLKPFKMAAAAVATTSLAETLRNKSAEVRNSNYAKINSSEKKLNDIKVFFDYIKKDAVNKMQIRAEKGYNSANILEYTYAEYFFIDEKNEVIRTPKYMKPTTENAKAYRIFEAIRTNEFKELLDEYKKELGDEMEIAMWWPGGNINVIEAIWGPTKYHRKGQYANNNRKYTPKEKKEEDDAETKTEVDTTAIQMNMQKINFNDEN
jgi:REP element-mobilizing transposase RayT